jgi:hypothetical protein
MTTRSREVMNATSATMTMTERHKRHHDYDWYHARIPGCGGLTYQVLRNDQKEPPNREAFYFYKEP